MANEDFNLKLGAYVNFDNARKGLENFKREVSTTSAILDLSKGNKEIFTTEKYINNLGHTYERFAKTVKTSNGELDKVYDVLIRTSNGAKAIEGSFAKAEQTLKNWNNVSNNMNNQGSANYWSTLDTQVSKVATDFQNLQGVMTSTSTSRYTDELNRTVTVTDTLDRNGQNIITTMRQYQGVMGENITETEVYNNTTKQRISYDKQSTLDTTKNTESIKENTQSKRENQVETEKLNKVNKSLAQSFAETVGKVAKFYLATAPIMAFQSALNEARQAIMDIDSALVEFRKVSDLSGNSLDNYIKKLGELGEKTGSTLSGMIEASTEFKKSGFTDEDSAMLASVAEMYRNIADEEISAGDSASFIISQMKAFNIEASNAQHIIDAVNEVSNNFAVSSADLANNLGKVSATLATNGVTFEEQLGMLTAITEITRNASTATRGLTQITSRLVQTLDDSSSTGKDLTKIYEGLGISLRDNEGQLRSSFDILTDLSKQWGNLSKNEQDSISLKSAGANQVKNFNALMLNFSQAIEATNTAYYSNGSAMKENERAMDSIDKKIQLLKAEFQKLIWGEGGVQQLSKSLLDVGIAILKFANSDIGQAIIKTILFTTAITSLYKLVNVMSFSKLGTALKMLSVQLLNSKASALGLGTALEALEINPVVLAITALVGSVVLVKTAYDKLNVTMEEHQENLANLSSEYEEAKQAVQDTEDKLKNVRKKIEEINSLEGAKVTREGELSELERKEAKLQSIYEIEKNRAELKKKEYLKEANDILGQEVLNPYAPTERVFTQAKEKGLPTPVQPPTQVLEETIDAHTGIAQAVKDASDEMLRQQKFIHDTANEYDSLNAKVDNGQKLTEGEKERLKSLIDQRGEANQKYDEANAYADQYVDSLKDIIEQAPEESEAYKEASDAFNYYGDALERTVDIRKLESDEKKENIDLEEDNAEAIEGEVNALEALADAYGVDVKALSKWAKALKMSEQQLTEYADSMGMTVEQAYDYKKGLDALGSDFDTMANRYKTLKTAVKEYNKDGKYSLETLESLLALEPQYLSLLEMEDGKLKLNKEGFKDLAQSLITQAKASLLAKTQGEIHAIVMEDQAKKAETLGRWTNEAGDKVKTYGQKAEESGNLALKGAKGWNEFWKQATNGVNVEGLSKESKDKIKQTKAEAKRELKSLDELGEGILKTLTDATTSKTTTSKTKSSKTKEDKWKEEYEAKKKALQHLLAMEKITEETYYEELMKLDKKYLEGRKKYIDEHRSNLEDFYTWDKERSKEKFDKEKDDLDHQLAMNMISQKTYTKKLEDLESKYLTNSKKNRKNYADYIKQTDEDIYNNQKAIYDKALEDFENYMEEQVEAYEETINAEVKLLEKQIKVLETQKKEVNDSYQKQIDALKNEKEARKDYYSQQIKNLETETSLRDKNIQLIEKEQALAKAKSNYKMVFKDGQFQYVRDEEAVSKAEQDLAEARMKNSNDNKKKLLEEARDSEQENYDERIHQLEVYQSYENSTIQNQIDVLQSQIDSRKEKLDEDVDNLNTYKKQIIKTLEQTAEGQNVVWSDMVKKVSDFTVSFNTELSKLGIIPTVSSALPNTSSVSLTNKEPTYVEVTLGSILGKNKKAKPVKKGGAISLNDATSINSLFNTLSGVSSASLNSSNVGKNQNISIGEIVLPQVKNGNDFINYLQNFSMDMTQLAYSR